MSWWKKLKGKVRLNEPLKQHTTFRIGGKAKVFAEPADLADLKLLINLAKRYKIPLLVIGAGSNVLISDKGVNAIVVHLASPCFREIKFLENTFLAAGSGSSLSSVVKESAAAGFSGMEFLAGIPGTVGGALVMNAGAWGSSIGDLVREVKVLNNNGEVKALKGKELRFTYRHSNLAKFIVLGANFRLSKGKKYAVKEKINSYLLARRKSQDLSFPSAGCVFKNPEGNFAGRLIEQAGLKGKSLGDASISKRHGNFFLNLGNAASSDVFNLIALAKKEVKNKFKVTLQTEIKIWQ